MKLMEALDLFKVEESAAQTSEDRLVLEQVLHAVRTVLTDDQRHVIILRFLEDMSHKQTAAILGKQVNHVKVVQNRAMALLRRVGDF